MTALQHNNTRLQVHHPLAQFNQIIARRIKLEKVVKKIKRPISVAQSLRDIASQDAAAYYLFLIQAFDQTGFTATLVG